MFSLKLNILKTRTMPSGSITSWQIDGETMKTVTYFISLGFKIIADDDCSHKIKKKIAPWKKSYYKYRQHIKKQRYYFADNVPYSQRYGYSSSHVWMWESDHNEGWSSKNCCFGTVVLDKTLESLEQQGDLTNQSKRRSVLTIYWRIHAEAPILWPPDVKSQLREDPDAGKDG